MYVYVRKNCVHKVFLKSLFQTMAIIHPFRSGTGTHLRQETPTSRTNVCIENNQQNRTKLFVFSKKPVFAGIVSKILFLRTCVCARVRDWEDQRTRGIGASAAVPTPGYCCHPRRYPNGSSSSSPSGKWEVRIKIGTHYAKLAEREITIIFCGVSLF